jgi:hypothetical protein
MTIVHQGQIEPDQHSQSAGSPTDLDLRRQLREAREELRALRKEQEQLGTELTHTEHLYAELHVRYVEMLGNCRATAAARGRGELDPAAFIAGHLEEIGLHPDQGAVPEHLVAEALTVVEQLTGSDL